MSKKYYPKGVTQAMTALGTVTVGKLSGEMTYGGGLFNLEVQDAQNQWRLVSNLGQPARDGRFNGIVDWGACQIVVSLLGPNGTRKFVHQNGSYPYMYGDNVSPRPPQVIHCNHIGSEVNELASFGRDSLSYDSEPPLVNFNTTVYKNNNKFTFQNILSRTQNLSEYQADHINAPWITLDTSKMSFITVNNTTTQAANFPTGSNVVTHLNNRDIFIGFSFNQVMQLSFDDKVAVVRHVKISNNLYIITPIYREKVLQPGESLQITYSIGII